MKKIKKILKLIGLGAYVVFLAYSFSCGFEPGKKIGENFMGFAMIMIKFLPPAFILIGLFEVWIKRKTVEKYLGTRSGIKGYLLVIMLASTTVGGLYVAFPVAYSLYNKGARLAVIFTYIGASAVCRVPMTIFEASFLGFKYSVIRIAVSIPLIVISSIMFERYLKGHNFVIKSGN